MRFRLRVVFATSIAVSLAIALACGAAFFMAKHAVLQAVDDSLLHTATSITHGDLEADHVRGSGFELVFADGTTFGGRQVPVDQAVLEIARHQSPAQFLTVNVGRTTFREYAVPVPRGTEMP